MSARAILAVWIVVGAGVVFASPTAWAGPSGVPAIEANAAQSLPAPDMARLDVLRAQLNVTETVRELEWPVANRLGIWPGDGQRVREMASPRDSRRSLIQSVENTGDLIFSRRAGPDLYVFRADRAYRLISALHWREGCMPDAIPVDQVRSKFLGELSFWSREPSVLEAKDR